MLQLNMRPRKRGRQGTFFIDVSWKLIKGELDKNVESKLIGVNGINWMAALKCSIGLLLCLSYFLDHFHEMLIQIFDLVSTVWKGEKWNCKCFISKQMTIIWGHLLFGAALKHTALVPKVEMIKGNYHAGVLLAQREMLLFNCVMSSKTLFCITADASQEAAKAWPSWQSTSHGARQKRALPEPAGGPFSGVMSTLGWY